MKKFYLLARLTDDKFQIIGEFDHWPLSAEIKAIFEAKPVYHIIDTVVVEELVRFPALTF